MGKYCNRSLDKKKSRRIFSGYVCVDEHGNDMAYFMHESDAQEFFNENDACVNIEERNMNENCMVLFGETHDSRDYK